MRLERAIRSRLFTSLVLSRLLYNVHVWSIIPKSGYAKLNSVYMRGLWRIAGAQRFQSTGHGSDESVRRCLGAQSLQCLILRRRLLLVSAIARFAPPFLTALLSARDAYGLQCLPWVWLVLHDLSVMLSHYPSKLAELGDPARFSDRWLQFARDDPVPWKHLVNNIVFAPMPLDKVEDKHVHDPRVYSFSCGHCGDNLSVAKGTAVAP